MSEMTFDAVVGADGGGDVQVDAGTRFDEPGALTEQFQAVADLDRFLAEIEAEEAALAERVDPRVVLEEQARLLADERFAELEARLEQVFGPGWQEWAQGPGLLDQLAMQPGLGAELAAGLIDHQRLALGDAEAHQLLAGRHPDVDPAAVLDAFQDPAVNDVVRGFFATYGVSAETVGFLVDSAAQVVRDQAAEAALEEEGMGATFDEIAFLDGLYGRHGSGDADRAAVYLVAEEALAAGAPAEQWVRLVRDAYHELNGTRELSTVTSTSGASTLTREYAARVKAAVRADAETPARRAPGRVEVRTSWRTPTEITRRYAERGRAIQAATVDPRRAG